jgi:hypothetical protein
MFGVQWAKGIGAWWIFVVSALAWLLMGSAGCSVTSWDGQATEGKHRTTWNHGLEIGISGWGIYIGPGRNSTTTVENHFEATAEGVGAGDDTTLDDAASDAQASLSPTGAKED